MTHNVLEKIFGSSSRVKIMKLFLFNDQNYFDKDDVSIRTKVSSSEVQRELKILSDISLIKSKVITKLQKTKTDKITKKKVIGYSLNPNFSLLKHLKNLLINNEPLQHADILKRIGKTGKIKLIIISGVFIQSEDSRLDLLVVGDQISERSLKSVISTMESEIGKELRFASLNTEDFKYRHSVCDRLIRDVLDYQHEVVVDRVGIHN